MDQDKWEPVAPNDLVFDTGFGTYGQVVVYRDPNRGLFGAVVRRIGGQWRKRVLPLVIVATYDLRNRPTARGRELPA